MVEDKVIAIAGIGYVGLLAATSFAKAGYHVIAYNRSSQRIEELQKGIDRNQEVDDLNYANLNYTSDAKDLKAANIYIITTPTPVDKGNKPDLTMLCEASKTISSYVKPGDVIICESTVFPGTCEEIIVPIIEMGSGLTCRQEFNIAYSSERIVPGSKKYNFSDINKVVAANDDKTLSLVAQLYGSIIDADIYCAESIKVAEASKILENTQRDVNIALMNEFAKIMHAINVDTQAVLKAANTKWNFLPFHPGLVGGHCISVDPYYLIEKANQNNIEAPFISMARKVNNSMLEFLFKEITSAIPLEKHSSVKIALLGLSFKPNVSDLRNSMAVLLYNLLDQAGYNVFAVDPLINFSSLDFDETPIGKLSNLDAMVLSTPHQYFIEKNLQELSRPLKKGGWFFDIDGVFHQQRTQLQQSHYWSM